MTRIGPVIISILVAIILVFGLALVLYKNLNVAPWAKEAETGRLHYHTKNTTRFGGTPEEVAQAIDVAVNLYQGPKPELPLDWRDRVLRHLPLTDAPRHVVVLPKEGNQAAAYALPGAYWAAYAGAPVVFVGTDRLTSAERRQLSRYPVPVYVLAPEKLISNAVVTQIRESHQVMRVANNSLSKHAIAIAQYRDPATDFGWGRTDTRRDGYFHFVLATPNEVEHAIEALPLASTNATTFLFAHENGGLPAATDQYLWHTRPEWFVTPAEGPFHHLWLIGNRISYAAQGRADLAVEKAPYPSLGPVAFGPMESLAVVLIALGIAGGIFVWLHAARLLPEVPTAMRFAWIFTAVLVPVGGVILYFAAYRRPQMHHGGMMHWRRPAAIQGAAATAMGFGYGAPLMIVFAYAFASLGFPLFFGLWTNGWAFVLGAGMPLMMVGMYLGAVLIAWPFVQYPMRKMMEQASIRRVFWTSLGVTALSMAAVSMGMMTLSWWMMMEKLPMMPKEDDILWFGSMWLASMIGFLVAWPLNWPMVRTQIKPGGM